MAQQSSSFLHHQMEPWSYRTSLGFTLRGWRNEPTGRPLIHFVHGNGYAGLVYEHMLSPLLEHADLFISDVQGHGDSDHGGRFRGWNGTAALCEEVLRHHLPDYRDETGGPVTVYGVGHSFGGVMTALMMARSPDLFQQSVLLDPVLFSPNMLRIMALSGAVGLWKRNTMASRARKRRAHWQEPQQAYENFHNRGIFRGWDERSLRSYLDHGLAPAEQGGVALKCRPERESEVFGSYPRRLWPLLQRVKTRTHIIYGSRTYPFVGQSALRWQKQSPRVSAERVPGGHCFMLERPEETAALIVDRLNLTPIGRGEDGGN